MDILLDCVVLINLGVEVLQLAKVYAFRLFVGYKNDMSKGVLIHMQRSL